MIRYTNEDRHYDETKENLLQVLAECSYSPIQRSGEYNGKYLVPKYTNKVEQQLKNLTGRKHCVATLNATSAICASLIALDVQPGDEVICTSLSYVASVNQVQILGATPVFCDVDDQGIIDLDQVENNITSRTKAILPVSLYGNTPDYDRLQTIADKHNLPVLNDTAQSMYAEYKGKQDGSFGDFSVFSFSRNKPVPTIFGFGAVLFDNDDYLGPITRATRNGKMNRIEMPQSKGMNAQPYDIHCAHASHCISKGLEWNNIRCKISEYYLEQLKNTPLDYIMAKDYCTTNWHKFVLKTNKRDELAKHLWQNDISAVKHYTDNLSKSPKMVNTIKLNNTVLSVPNHNWLTDSEVEKVANTIKDFF